VTKQNDLTEGVIWKKLCLFALPILAGNFLQQMYVTADAVIIGQFAGKSALACLKWLNIPEEIRSSTLSYLRIYFTGLSVSMTYNIGAGILRALGHSKQPFYCLIVANGTNILMDLLFVGVFKWDVTGAAVATVISQLLSAVMILYILMKAKLPLNLYLNKLRFHKSILRRIFALGLPIGVQSSFFPIANMLIQSKINSFGIDSIAAWAVCGKLDFLIWLVIDSMGSAVSTFTAQNFGAKQFTRVKRGVLAGTGIAAGIVLTLSAGLYIGSEPLSRLFVNDASVIVMSAGIIRFMAPFYFCYIGGEILSAAICGTGETFRPMLLTLTGTCVCRVLWVLIVVPLHPELKTVLWSYPVSWIVTSVLFIGFYMFYMQNKLFTQAITRKTKRL
jgi:putative MATE family efflux protein